MAFYPFAQTNSGGSFDLDTEVGIDKVVFIEAASAEEANNKALAIGLYFNGVTEGPDCSCCGNRWQKVDPDHSLDEVSFLGSAPSTFIHYRDGSFGRPRWVAQKDKR